MTMSESGSRRMTRREAIEVIGMSAACAAAIPGAAFAQTPPFPKGAIIRTLLKDYAPEELAGGATLFHEHLSLGPDFNDKFRAAAAAVRAAQGLPPLQGRGGGPPAPPPGPDPMRDVDLMAKELTDAKADGVACIVDGGHPDMGRDLDFVRQASIKSGVPIVAGAGFYSEPFYPKEIATTERKVFRAVGKAHLATNLPIFTHTGIPGKSALEQLDILEDAGVNPNRVVIGHLGNLVDQNVYVHKTICRRGAFIGFDRQGV